MRKKEAYKVSIITIIINCALSIIKLLAGFISNSKAVISDGIHSLGDVITTVIVMIGIFVSSKKEDSKHPYGHERIESIVAIILSGVLFVIGLGIGISGVEQILSKSYNDITIIGNVAIIAALVSIIVKEWLFWYTRRIAKKINSNSLMAEAWHHRTDVLASIGSLIGVVFAKMGYPIVDSIASIIISLFIIKTSINIFTEAMDGLIDKSCNNEFLQNVQSIILNNKNVLCIPKVKSRKFSSKVYLDIEVGLPSDSTLDVVHKIVKNIHDEIERNIHEVKHCNIYAVPVYKEDIDT